MLINDIPFTLKDGRRAVLRSPRAQDAEEVIRYLTVSAGETEFIMRYPEECDRYTVQGEIELFDRVNTSENEVMLLCLVEGRVAGNSSLKFNNYIKTRHRATVAIALMKEYWGQGIGTRMFQEMIRLCQAREGLLQMELGFVEGNNRARSLYEKMGFRVTGVNLDAFRLKDGRLLNEYLMIRKM